MSRSVVQCSQKSEPTPVTRPGTPARAKHRPTRLCAVDVSFTSIAPARIARPVRLASRGHHPPAPVQLESFDAKQWVRLVRDESVTHAMVVPTMLNRILDVIVGVR